MNLDFDHTLIVPLLIAAGLAFVVWRVTRRRVRRLYRSLGTGATVVAAFGGMEYLPMLAA